MLTVQKGKQLQVHMDREWNNIQYLRKDEGTTAFAIKTETDLVRHGIVAS